MILNPWKKQISSTLGAVMIHRNNLAKLFTRPGELLTPVGGAVGHTYFQFQHMHLHHQNIKQDVNGPSSVRSLHCNCELRNGQGTSSSNSNSSVSQLDLATKAKLIALKERLSENVYFEKYKEKFQQLELTSPRELVAKLERLDARFNRVTTGSKNATTTATTTPHSNKGSGLYSHTKTHVLKDVMELHLVKDLERDDVIYVWQEFHRKKEGLLAAVMSGTVFDRMVDLASIHPLFLMPLPRDNGYEFFFVQYMDKAFHFTPLLLYQTHKENAPVCIRLINYTDLQDDKDLVLMRGEYDKNLLTPQEAHIMAVQVNFYYGETSESRTKLLETFSKNPDSFQHMELIKEFEKLKESHPHLFELQEDD